MVGLVAGSAGGLRKVEDNMTGVKIPGGGVLEGLLPGEDMKTDNNNSDKKRGNSDRQ
jgi:hypothetical protein